MPAPKVFISYSHDSPEHSERVLQLSSALRNHGVDAELDRYQVRPPKGWPHWCEEQLRPENSDFVLMICTENYLKRVTDKVPADEGRGVFWEGAIIYGYIYDAKVNKRFIPVLFGDRDSSFIPVPLRYHTSYRVKAFDFTDAGYQDLYRELTGQPLVIKPPVGPVIVLAGRLPATAMPLEARPVRTDFPPVIGACFKSDISRILKYAPAELVGREDELKLLDDAWSKVQSQEKGRPRILTFVALGGEGKTALMAKWVAELAAQDWPGCEAAFAWSFYSQGTREQQAASSDFFLKEALNFFGDDADKAFAASPAGAFEKGQRLARIVGQQRSLLILDGLEPLQYAPTSPTPGELKDQGIASLLKGLAASSQGLCLVTTRYSLLDLKAFWPTPSFYSGRGAGGEGTAHEVNLLRLSRDASVYLLKSLGVKGSELRNIPSADSKEHLNEFEILVEDVKGHALTLTLLGGFLKRAFHGDIRQRDRVKFEKADAMMDGGHAFRTLAAYEQWLLRDGDDEGRREMAVLRLMGLFDRAAEAGCLNALLQPPVIPGLTEPLIGIAEEDWNFSLDSLESAKLLTVNRDESSFHHSSFILQTSLDAHPHIREYFAKQLREQKPDAWHAAHQRLYEHLCTTTNEGDQPTLEDLQPLYQAVAHGCQAGLHQQTLEQVLKPQIFRGWASDNVLFGATHLGAWAETLSALASFIETPWSRIVSTLSVYDQGYILSAAAFCLRALCRFSASLEAAQSAVVILESAGDWLFAAKAARIGSQTAIALGQLTSALILGKKAVELAKRGPSNNWELLHSIARYSEALHHAGKFEEARLQFAKLMRMVKRQKSSDFRYVSIYEYVDAFGWYEFCDFLLTRARIEQESGNSTRAWSAVKKWVPPFVSQFSTRCNRSFYIGLARLLDGRMHLVEGLISPFDRITPTHLEHLRKASEL